MSLGLNVGGTFSTGAGDAATVQVRDAELEVPRRIHDMAHDGWEATLDGAQYLTTASFQGVSDYPQWKDRSPRPRCSATWGTRATSPPCSAS